jgi:small conductance mechanosensitive channel
LDQFANSAVMIKARTTTKPIKQWRIGREFNRRLKKAFDERKIEIPFPHVTLYMGEDKKGGSAPLQVLMQNRQKTPSSE